jgi:hypothetical protein
MWRAFGQGRDSAGHGMGGLDRGEVAEGNCFLYVILFACRRKTVCLVKL